LSTVGDKTTGFGTEERVGLDVPGLTACSRIPPLSLDNDADARGGAEKPVGMGTVREGGETACACATDDGETDSVAVVSANFAANKFIKESNRSESEEN
jgi:hypothetical protein